VDAPVTEEDAGDGSCPETDPCWVRIDEGPDYCVFEEARNPGVTFEPRWVPCDRTKDCLELQLESTNETSYHVLKGPVFSSAEPVFGVAIENRESPARERVLVLTSVDRVSAAWRSDVTDDSAICGFGTPSSGYGNLVVGLGAVHEARPEELYSKVLIETEERGREVVDFPNLLVGVSMSADIIVAKANFTFETFAFVDGEFVPMAEPGAISKSGAWTHVAGPRISLTKLAKLVAAFRPTVAFVRRKLARLDRMIARAQLDAASRARMRKASRDILRLVLADRRREASRRISKLMRRLAR